MGPPLKAAHLKAEARVVNYTQPYPQLWISGFSPYGRGTQAAKQCELSTHTWPGEGFIEARLKKSGRIRVRPQQRDYSSMDVRRFDPGSAGEKKSPQLTQGDKLFPVS
jgi:hypothetical protein